jgi:hypothetical protein
MKKNIMIGSVPDNTIGNGLEINPPPFSILFNNPKNGEFLGRFFEKDGKLSFEGKADESAEEFVNFICNIFHERVNFLINSKEAIEKDLDDFNQAMMETDYSEEPQD